MKMNLKLIGAALVLAGMASTPSLEAQPSAHYVPGIEGIKAASLPPPGLYLRDYNVGYYASRINDGNGDKIDMVDPDAFIYANVPRLLWITDWTLLGGNIGFDGLLPLQYTDLEIDTPLGSFSDSDFGIGDAFAEVTWSKHIQFFDFALGYGLWFPTGNSDPGLSAAPGLGYFTHMFTAGLTYYMDPEKRWALSLLNRYEINMEKDDTDITPGHVWTLEAGGSYAISKTLDVGVVGYYQTQVTEDSGTGATDVKDWVAGVGPEVGMMYPKYKLGWTLRYVYEVAAENRMQGHTAVFTLTKIF
jgi:hypothetical protein